ncbi:hypothetical protein [Marinilabilia rubra]|uniref:Uncharacterized protein n=1 Tax=Marinilabilia rubra TaxID=2162893 RepID=A0A2U2B5J7_9BACT|nr:hypothetical protein [Marinilabilia rubra]PWD98325.1 hypothetical protein DDZ16_16245 [Marinilabilia rubra]
MKNISINILLILAVLAGSVMINACDEGYRINTKELLQEEQALMEEYFNEEKDSLAQLGDSIDDLRTNGFAFFETQEGTGDSVKVGKKVGFRCIYYEIVRDSLGVPFLFESYNNYGDPSPKIYIAGNPDIYNNIYPGVDEAIKNMTYGSKARAFISSRLWTGNYDYTPWVVDLEVTYLEK